METEKLVNRINENSDTIGRFFPFSFFCCLRVVCNSLWSFVVNRFHAIAWYKGINHILSGMKSSSMKVLAQLKDMFMVLVDGPNTENKFIIIFSLWFSLGSLFF